MSEQSPHWLTPDEQHAWRSFVRLHQKLAATIARDLQAHAKLSGADFEVLVALTDVPDHRRRFQDLAKAIDWEQSRLSHQIARMIKRGLVVREECAEDGRAAFVCLTSAGHDAIQAAAPHHVRAIRHLVIDALAPGDLDALARISNRILDRIDSAQA
ncbi:MarR family transcriptional regulator [Actinoplanes sp. ATCC 53533]|uniref:MarR family winged helix-turn-helix transcriptional regulator n=1 Tax=Actinoplanes sp. ATCC 53533 TaxID=1288362 RepID=UPI000F7AD593|nr:MarR family winged helix-turn-helix transcriptional regulator [Actinoplanes sp. ATCC 53533]RSM45918.1 MarR family transcriptional regulator [Actinoplanes sp. ATCC 53533]